VVFARSQHDNVTNDAGTTQVASNPGTPTLNNQQCTWMPLRR